MDLSLVEDAWARLRATRWKAPGSGARRRTYQTSLNQAEELFRAAAMVSPASRPLPLFYGLSQAGRAIAASAPHKEWKLQGHGIKCPEDGSSLPELRIFPDGNAQGSFERLSVLLDSPLWEKQEVRLKTLWDCIPSAKDVPLGPEKPDRRTPLYLFGLDELRAVSVPPALHVGGFPRSLHGLSDTALHTYMQAFPETKGTPFATMGKGAAGQLHEPSGGATGAVQVLYMELANLSVEEQLASLNKITRQHQGSRIFSPAPHPAAERGMHPLMAWWAVLFALSMLARYQPSEWAQCIDVDSSEYAVPIEHMLSSALEVVPRLILEALHQVDGSGREPA